jgi:hypothetical protein
VEHLRSALEQFLDHRASGISRSASYQNLHRITPSLSWLDFLAEYVGTDRDPRLKQELAKGYSQTECLRQHRAPEHAKPPEKYAPAA